MSISGRMSSRCCAECGKRMKEQTLTGLASGKPLVVYYCKCGYQTYGRTKAVPSGTIAR